MRRAIHLGRLVRELVMFSVVDRVWWLLPLSMIIALLVLLVGIGQAVAPYTIYPML